MKSLYCLILIAFLLVSCSSAPSGDVVQTAIAQTQIAQPTNTLLPIPTDTPTPIPLSDLDLSSALVQASDLPAGYSGAQIRNTPPRMFDNIPEPINQIYQQFEQNNESAGGVGVFVYGSKLDADNAYKTILDGMGNDTKLVSDIGTRARMVLFDMTLSGVNMSNSELLFFLCNTVVHIRITGSANEDYITSYAQRLDKRLTPLVCR